LERSNAAFDAGHLSEAVRTAVPLRVLFHQTPKSHALVNQLGLENALTWVDTAGLPDPNNLSTHFGLTQMGIHIENGKGTPVMRGTIVGFPARAYADQRTAIATRVSNPLSGVVDQYGDQGFRRPGVHTQRARAGVVQ
jgi:hypothetical protein